MNRYDMTEFKWESETQMKGYGSFVIYCRAHGRDPEFDEIPAQLVASYFAQKQHEANVWLVDLIAEQCKMLRDEVEAMREELRSLKAQQN